MILYYTIRLKKSTERIKQIGNYLALVTVHCEKRIRKLQREVGALRSLVSDSLVMKGMVSDYLEYLDRDDEEVDLQSFSCKCLDFQELMYPCKHDLRKSVVPFYRLSVKI